MTCKVVGATKNGTEFGEIEILHAIEEHDGHNRVFYLSLHPDSRGMTEVQVKGNMIQISQKTRIGEFAEFVRLERCAGNDWNFDAGTHSATNEGGWIADGMTKSHGKVISDSHCILDYLISRE